MPEHAEIYAMSQTINRWAVRTRVVALTKSPVHKSPAPLLPLRPGTASGCVVAAVSRGKELLLAAAPTRSLLGKVVAATAAAEAELGPAPSTAALATAGVRDELIAALAAASGKDGLVLVVGMGMTGTWKVVEPGEEMPRHAHLRFEGDDGSVLVFEDMRRLSRWRCHAAGEAKATWTAGRGPDSLREPAAFAANIERGRGTAAFGKMLCDALLNQRYFNGIGNYLRAEIMHRAGLSPFITLDEALELPQGGQMLKLVASIPHEVMQLAEAYEPAKAKEGAFAAWLTAYGKLESVRDKAARTVWFDATQHKVPSAMRATLGKGRVRGIESRSKAKSKPKTAQAKPKAGKAKLKAANRKGDR